MEGFAFLFVTSVLFYLSLPSKSTFLPIQKRFESVYEEQHEKSSICILIRNRQYVTIIIKLSHPKNTITCVFNSLLICSGFLVCSPSQRRLIPTQQPRGHKRGRRVLPAELCSVFFQRAAHLCFEKANFLPVPNERSSLIIFPSTAERPAPR